MLGQGATREGDLAMKYACVSMVGFATDALLLHLGVEMNLAPAWARVISLIAAMQVTFLLNGLVVFRCLDRSKLPKQWSGYMLTNGFGNFCNYWVFVTLTSFHLPLDRHHMLSLCVGAFTAWLINYASTRFVVFRRRKTGAAREPNPGEA